MKLISQIIERKMENYRVLKTANQEELAYQEHISAYLLCLAYLNITDKSLSIKEHLWRSVLVNENQHAFIRLLKYKPSEDNIIIQTLNKMNLAIEEQLNNFNPLYPNFCWAILSYEHEVEE